jgi:hypothetical protein
MMEILQTNSLLSLKPLQDGPSSSAKPQCPLFSRFLHRRWHHHAVGISLRTGKYTNKSLAVPILTIMWTKDEYGVQQAIDDTCMPRGLALPTTPPDSSSQQDEHCLDPHMVDVPQHDCITKTVFLPLPAPMLCTSYCYAKLTQS